jgi:hypothetical protein
MNLARQLRLLSIALPLLALPVNAAASETYPTNIKAKLMLDAAPGPGKGCQLCHKDDEGGTMNVDKPFGLALMRADAKGANIPSLLAAIDVLEADGEDSDGDGTPDIAELRAGSDPNVGEDGSIPMQVPLPQTGCSVRARAGAGCAWAAALPGLLWLCRRRRQRKP